MSSSYSTRKPAHASGAQQAGQSPVHHEAMQQAWQIFQLGSLSTIQRGARDVQTRGDSRGSAR